MSLRGLRLATQFLTRVPVAAVRDFSPDELARSAAWFPVVGLGLGLGVAAVLWLCETRSATLAAGLGVLAWVWLTGALHLDGLGDLADALAAAHRDPQRLFAVLADPHLGTFGVTSVVLVLILKFAALTQVANAAQMAVAHTVISIALPAHWSPLGYWRHTSNVPSAISVLAAIPLIAAWARLGPLAWSRWLKPLKPGHGERFAWRLHTGWIVLWTVLLLAISAALTPVLCVAPLVIAGWGGWLQARLGGMTGDCLGAGVEVTETVLLIAACLAG